MRAFRYLCTYLFCVFFGAAAFAQEPLSANQLKQIESNALDSNDVAFNLGYAYLNGVNGVPKDLVRAEYWFTHLTQRFPKDKHVAFGAYLLGKLYLGMEAHEVDEKKAKDYLEMILAFRDLPELADGIYHYARLSDKDEDYIKYLEISANNDFVPAAIDLYVANLEGKRIAQNDMAALKWLKVAARGDNADAQAHLGAYYFNGYLTYKDYEQAYYWTVRAAEQNHAGAQARLGLMYKLGLGRSVDYDKAELWFERAAAQGDLLGKENLAALMLDGQDKQKQQQAVVMMEEVASQGMKSAALTMAQVYEKGLGAEADAKKAQYWLAEADKLSDAQGSQFIGINKGPQKQRAEYRTDAKAMEHYRMGIDYAMAEDWEKARRELEKAANLSLPAAQLDLAKVIISQSQQQQQQQQEALLEVAYGWAKLANDSKQEGADSLLEQMTDAFPAKMIEQGLIHYQRFKEQVAKASQAQAAPENNAVRYAMPIDG
ncbi:tetratricopeptide repeat protein [Aliiglaciecola sp. CAU 1673]|uniref:tetratricopeptide repeat protein n=1 Tax=Aliiglaciecola sp. CAU 1673 TaxID=3032595 RepID=UPI0023DCA63C|nr:tetratricopeptide repeat protein [Aliiglaciecola sp. CAU 1673]MDF2177426.1 tetratricopeptide repeat protein [Aliiglaciecola sp. CAU 1673]